MAMRRHDPLIVGVLFTWVGRDGKGDLGGGSRARKQQVPHRAFSRFGMTCVKSWNDITDISCFAFVVYGLPVMTVLYPRFSP